MGDQLGPLPSSRPVSEPFGRREKKGLHPVIWRVSLPPGSSGHPRAVSCAAPLPGWRVGGLGKGNMLALCGHQIDRSRSALGTSKNALDSVFVHIWVVTTSFLNLFKPSTALSNHLFEAEYCHKIAYIYIQHPTGLRKRMRALNGGNNQI